MKRKRAQAMIEFAIVIPIFILLLMLFSDAVWVGLQRYELNLIAADAARAGSQQPNAATAENMAKRVANGRGAILKATSATTCGTSNDWRGRCFNVTVKKEVQLLFPFAGVLADWYTGNDEPPDTGQPGGADEAKKELTLTASSTFRVGLHRAWRD